MQACGKKKRQQIIQLTKSALTLINALSAKVFTEQPVHPVEYIDFS